MKLRLVIALLLLGCLFYFVGAVELLQIFRQIDPVYLTLLLALAVVMVWASCLKWQLFIRASGNEVPILHLMKLYTVGYFFNTFTPSYVGGDLARSFHLGRYLSNQRDALIATFLERFTGLLAMSLLGVVFLVLGSKVTAGLSIAILTVAAGALFLSALCFSKSVAEFFFPIGKQLAQRFVPQKMRAKVDMLIDRVDEGMQHARRNIPLLGKALLLSLFFHCLTVLNTYLAARSIGWQDPDVAGLFVVVPLVLLVSMAPITPAGLGIQEGAFLFLLQRIGGSHAQGLGVGLVLRAKVMLLGIVGGLLWLHVRGQGASPGEANCDDSNVATSNSKSSS